MVEVTEELVCANDEVPAIDVELGKVVVIEDKEYSVDEYLILSGLPCRTCGKEFHRLKNLSRHKKWSYIESW